MGLNLRGTDATLNTFFERLNLVLGLRKFAPWVNCPYAPTTPTIYRTTISRFPFNSFCQYDSKKAHGFLVVLDFVSGSYYQIIVNMYPCFYWIVSSNCTRNDVTSKNKSAMLPRTASYFLWWNLRSKFVLGEHIPAQYVPFARRQRSGRLRVSHIYAMESAAVQQRIQQQEKELQCKPTILSLHLWSFELLTITTPGGIEPVMSASVKGIPNERS